MVVKVDHVILHFLDKNFQSYLMEVLYAMSVVFFIIIYKIFLFKSDFFTFAKVPARVYY